MKVSIRGPIVSSNDHRFYRYAGMEATSPQSVADAIAKGNGERAEVEINSGGGDIFAASEIYTTLKNYSGGVHIRIVGLAASAASVIAMAGKSEMTPTGMMMIHNVQSYADGDYRALEHTASVLRLANSTIAAAYRAKTGRPEKEITDMMDAETWITADKAVELGLVDRVMDMDDGQHAMTADYCAGMLSAEAIERIKNLCECGAKNTCFAEREAARLRAELDFLRLRRFTR